MRSSKFSGSFLVAAMVLAAAAFASPASADVLCSTNTNPCTGTSYGTGQVFSMKQNGAAELAMGGFPVKCTESSMGGEITGANEKAVSAKVTSMSFSKCTLFSLFNCTATTSVQAGGYYLASFDATGEGNGKLVITTGSREYTITFNCGSGAGTCTFGEGNIQMQFTGSATEPKLLAKGGFESDLKYKSGAGEGTCGATSELRAGYTFGTPSALFLE